MLCINKLLPDGKGPALSRVIIICLNEAIGIKVTAGLIYNLLHIMCPDVDILIALPS